MSLRKYYLFLTLLGISSCQFDIRSKLNELAHPENPLAPKALRSPTPDLKALRSLTQKRNLELLKEMITVVTLENPTPSEFSEWASILSQGASLEGIYNGLTHSDRQRQRENGKGATPRALKSFVTEMELIQSKMKSPTHFGPQDSKPLSEVEAVEYVEPESASSTGPSGSKTQNRAELERIFVTASLFTLKRILGDEVLLLIREKQRSKEDLSKWYGEWASSLSLRKVSFGISKRNESSKEFHENWAKTADVDLLSWECLNRAHRILNSQ